MRKAKKLPPISPGEMLIEEFLKPMGISKYRLAKEIGVPAQRIGEIVAGRRAITAALVQAFQMPGQPYPVFGDGAKNQDLLLQACTDRRFD